MDWTKHGKEIQASKRGRGSTIRKAIPITPELQKAIELFKSTYSDTKFTDTDVIKTMIEAGFKEWFNELKRSKEESNDQSVVEDNE